MARTSQVPRFLTLMVAEKRFRRLNAPHLLKDVYAQHHRKNKITIDSGKKLAA